jgi:hypothetical protein
MAVLSRILSGFACALVLCGALLPTRLRAQDADSVRVAPPDTARAAARPEAPAVGFLPPPAGNLLDDRPPVRRSALGLPDLLAEVPGSFLYDFGAVGWPDGWSPFGLNPNFITLALNGLPFDDLVMGRPRYDLLPFGFLEPVRTRPLLFDGAYAALTQVQPYRTAQPLTELRYRSARPGMQGVSVVHVQERNRPLFGRPGRLNMLFGYAGQGAKGEYDGSRLRRARQLLLRLRYARQGWSLELQELYNRRRLGAHAGVQPIAGAAFESIYQRLGANVENPNAVRGTRRNDLSLTARFRLLPPSAGPFTASLYRQRQRARYHNNPDTLTARVRRTGVRLTQTLHPGNTPLLLQADLWEERVRGGDALPDSLDLRRRRFHLTARDTVGRGLFRAVLEAGLHGGSQGSAYPSGLLDLGVALGPARLFAEGSYSGQPVPWAARYGYGGTVTPLQATPDVRTTLVRAGAGLQGGPFDATVFAFMHRTANPIDYFLVAEPDTIAVRVGATPHRIAGLGADLGWRRAAPRGVYLTVQPTVLDFLNPGDSADHRRVAESLPGTSVRGRLGARLVLFQRDLDLNVYLQGRYWAAMRSRTLHPATGLLVVPEAGSRPVEASATVDLYIEAGIRTATLFIAYENMMAGTQLLLGNMIVPVYPLPDQRFRFGVFWPFEN